MEFVELASQLLVLVGVSTLIVRAFVRFLDNGELLRRDQRTTSNTVVDSVRRYGTALGMVSLLVGMILSGIVPHSVETIVSPSVQRIVSLFRAEGLPNKSSAPASAREARAPNYAIVPVFYATDR